MVKVQLFLLLRKYDAKSRSLREMRTLVRIIRFKNPLTFYSLADFFVGRTAYCTQLYVET